MHNFYARYPEHGRTDHTYFRVSRFKFALDIDLQSCSYINEFSFPLNRLKQEIVQVRFKNPIPTSYETDGISITKRDRLM
jgi:hypothetical protein